MKLKLVGVVAALAVGLAGCSGGDATDGGTSKFCTSTSCGTGETCHPSSKTCVKTCTKGDDCSSEAKNCAPAIGGSATADGGSLLVCSCVTSALCSGGVAGNICSDVDKVCTSKCASNSDCPNNRTCDTATGQCGAAGGSACTRGSCSASQVCNFQSGACEAPKTCSAGNAQPDVCGYGQFCSTATCAEVAIGTCSNFAAGSNPLLWNPKTSTGPAIYEVSKVSIGTDAVFCGAGAATTRAKVHVKAYATTAVLISETNQPALVYMRTDGNELPVGANQIQNYVSTGGGKAAEFDVNFCAPTGVTSLTVGLFYTTGNAACATVN